MRLPTWEVSPGALAALLNGIDRRQLRMVDLFTFTLARGALVLRYSGGDEVVRANSRTWALGPKLGRTRTRLTSRLEVDTCDVSISAEPDLLVNGAPMVPFIASGGFDGGRVLVERAFSGGPGQPWQGALHLFEGRVGPVSGGRHQKVVQVRSDIELLDAMVPRNVYQPACLNNLYDTECGISRATHQLSGAATSVADSLGTTFSHNLGTPSGPVWALGELEFTSGQNAGIRRTVVSNSGGAVLVIEPWPRPVVAGDAFNVWPGCDRTRGTCIIAFGNLGRFRGTPFVPAADSVI